MGRLLNKYLDQRAPEVKGLPTVEFLADQLHFSPSYLSDMLRSLTGQNAQQHIHAKLVEKAQEVLVTTSLSLAEIAYQLGLKQPQSLNRLFKEDERFPTSISGVLQLS